MMFCFSSGWSVGKDGPGQRFIVYLKGCNMRCLWCANPESISVGAEMMFYPERSENPVDYVCPLNAVESSVLDREKCVRCVNRECIVRWKNRCFELAGFEMSPDELSEKIVAFKEMFGTEGGLTFGGGEPSLQSGEILRTVKLLKPHKIHVAVESNASTSGFRDLVDKVDLIICDIKCITEKKHLEWTGIGNSTILDNIRYAAKNQRDLVIRIPLVEGLNTDEEEMEKICTFISGAIRKERPPTIEILRMHHIGEPKYAALGMEYRMKGHPTPENDKVNELKMRLDHHGIKIRN